MNHIHHHSAARRYAGSEGNDGFRDFPKMNEKKGLATMKKLTNAALALALALALIVGMAGCGAQQPQATQPAPTETQPLATEPAQVSMTVTEESTYSKPLPGLPEVPYWFPAQLLEWNPDQDPDAMYNVSSVPLAKRVDKSQLATANSTQCRDMNVVAISIMNGSTSGNAPHGLNTPNVNVFSYWQYIDKLVYWGGSSGEGLIVCPSADVIDAAHRNGVPVMGTVFFPQAAHGGKVQWLNDFLQKDASGSFPIIDKLITVCEYFGFDGWFLNQETEDSLTADHAALMQEFVKAFKAKTDLEIMWYDSMTEQGEMDWQNALTDKNVYALVDQEGTPVADDMFLNFWWNTETYAPAELLKASAEKAAEVGVNPYDLYAGIDIQANGYKTPVRWNLFAPEGQAPYTSLGLYCPSWTYFSANDFFTDYQERENLLWVNAAGDPFAASQGDWKGVSTYAVENTVLTGLPFITNFSMGHGYFFNIDGVRVSNKDWNDRSMQDILPTYRYHVEQPEGNALEGAMDYSDAYYGGTSLRFVGKMAAGQTSTALLYSARLPITDGASFTMKAKANQPMTMDLVLTLDSGAQVIPGDQAVGTDWTTVTYDVSGLAGKTVTGLGIAMTSDSDAVAAKLLLGQIAVTDGTESTDTSASGLKVDGTSFDDDDCIYTGVRLNWQGSADHYEVYRVNQDGSLSFLDATPATACYINALERNDDTNKTSFLVVPVSVTGVHGAPSNTVTMDWPNNSLPKADFKASATLAAPGEEITFYSLCSANAETLSWEFPGASVETSTDASPVVTYASEGTYTVKVTAKNASGEAVAEKANLITITSAAADGLQLLSQGKDTQASAYVNDNEAPPFAVDGDVTKKWCATGTPPHEITIDLGSLMTVCDVRISHAEAGGESPDMNTKAYTIQVSENGTDFTTVVTVTKNFEGVTSDTFQAVKAQYVKLIVEKPTQGSDSAARIYEIEVYGLAD